MPLFGECKNISQTASLGETHFSLIACLHVCLYFFTTFCDERQGAQRERERINLVGRRIYAFQDGGGEQLLSFFSVFFVGGDREVRRYLFHSCASEIEFELISNSCTE